MGTLFMNLENSKISFSHRLALSSRKRTYVRLFYAMSSYVIIFQPNGLSLFSLSTFFNF